MTLLHHLTHRHATLSKTGVGKVVLCRRRWPRTPWCVHVRVDGNPEWRHVDQDSLSRLIEADTAGELRDALND